MSGHPRGPGMSYGVPTGRGYGNEGWNQGPPRQKYAQQPHMRSPLQQRNPLQSDSERRYVERNAQQLPESFRSGLGTDYEEDLHDYQQHAPASMRSPHNPQWQNPVAPHAPRAQPNFQPPHRQFSNQAPVVPRGAWPARGESAPRHDDTTRGPPQQLRERQHVPEQQQQPPRPDHRPGGELAGAAAYPDYPGPTQHPQQPSIQEPMLSDNDIPAEPQIPAPTPDQWEGADMLTPPTANPHRPVTDSSVYSQSSTGSIPDFPMPQDHLSSLKPPQPLFAGQRDSARQMPMRIPLGPPPSARRGPSSYYSQSSFVAPIVEEGGSRSSHGSPRFDHRPDDAISDDGYTQDGRTSPAEDHDDSSELVYHANTGQKARPSVVPIVREPGQGGVVAKAVTSAGAAGGAFAAGLGSSRSGSSSPLRMPGAFADPADSDASSSTFDEKARDAKVEKAGFKRAAMASMDFFGGAPTSAFARTNSPTLRTGSPFSAKNHSLLAGQGPDSKVSGSLTPASQNSDKMAAIMVGLEKGGALEKDMATGPRTPRSGFGEKAGLKLPPRINIDAVKDAEARGSLTSLPDLIKRATRLASNLDRGKTASRLGLEWFTAEPKAQPEQRNSDYRKSATMSAILASFPPPGLATPPGERGRTRDTNATGWPQYAPKSANKRRPRREIDERFVFEKPGKPKERRCCGMPLWGFILVMIVLLAVIVAAVVIPIAVVVLPKQNSSNNGANSALSACQKSSPCQNGGSSVIGANGTCSCLCTNGFTGSSCSTGSDAACTSMAVAGQPEATVGSAIPRLLNAAESNYSIPLDSARVLAQFSSGDVSCNTENALVTLAGQSSRGRAIRSINNLFVPLPHASNPFVPSGSRASAAATPIPAGQGPVHFFDVGKAGWDDGQERYMPRPTHAAKLKRRATPNDNDVIAAAGSSEGGQTINGILVATGSPSEVGAPSAPTAGASSDPGSAGGAGPSATASSSSPSATGGSEATSTSADGQQSMDFARTVILFVLQETGSLSDASDAQSRLSRWFAQNDSGSGDAASVVDLGASGWSINLADFQVTVANGTQYGGGAY